MITISKVSKIAGISIRTLQYYDKIGLLTPSNYTETGYRLYSDKDLKRLQYILLFKELGFSLKEITMMNRNFDIDKALDNQINSLMQKKDHLEHLIILAKSIKKLGVNYMDFKAFNDQKHAEYVNQAKDMWSQTKAFKEFEVKEQQRTADENKFLLQQLMVIFSEFGDIKDLDPSSTEAQSLVHKLQSFITEHFYYCSDDMLSGLGEMYSCHKEFTENIDEIAGSGTATFVTMAIKKYLES